MRNFPKRYYHSKCPHCETLLTSRTAEEYSYDDRKIEEPIFWCKKCGCYYLATRKPELHDVAYKPIEETKVFFSKESYRTMSRETHPDFNGEQEISIFTNEESSRLIGERDRSTKRKERKIAPLKSYRYSISGEVRIHVLDKSEEEKMGAAIIKLKTAYPGLLADNMTINDLIHRVFDEGFEQECIVRNVSIKQKGVLKKQVKLYNCRSSYLMYHMPDNEFLVFSGTLEYGELIINGLQIIENPVFDDNDILAYLTFYYDGQRKKNVLWDVAQESIAESEELNERLELWQSYLEWKRKITESKISGLKYVNFKIDLPKKEYTFLTVVDGIEHLNRFKKFLNRNDVSVFSNEYSDDRWTFAFNKAFNGYQNPGVHLNFARIGRFYDLKAVRTSSWLNYRNSAKRYSKDEQRVANIWNIVDSYYAKTIFVEIVFEFSEAAEKLLKRQLRMNEDITDDIKEKIEKEFFSEGFIATTQVGDFALINRLEKGLYDLLSERCAAPLLNRWLFDILEARTPDVVSEITDWQNENINESQKEAVEKILAAPDICLIQGPPGTGKTTVIAEAVYQLVSRNKRVLIASQANLAVDNALERLISNPRIRAIRLGNAEKIDSSVSNITEDHVLQSFYQSVVRHIHSKYLSVWDEADHDLENYKTLKCKIENLNQEISALERQQEEILNSSHTNDVFIQSLESDRMWLGEVQQYLDDKLDRIGRNVSYDLIKNIWNEIRSSVSEINRTGLVLMKTYNEVPSVESFIYCLSNIKVLLRQLNHSEHNGRNDDMAERLESLIHKEIYLREQMALDEDIYAEWRKVIFEIKNIKAESSVLPEAVLTLFNAESLIGLDNTRKEKVIREQLNQNKPLLIELRKQIIMLCLHHLEQIPKQIELQVKTGLEFSAGRKILAEKINVSRQDISSYQKECERILTKYSAVPDNLEDRIKESLSNKDAKVNVHRGLWEEIFKGFTMWVDSIPDYTQEKEIYLKNYINGCNVVGISCTENMRVLDDKGFDDFDVVIIDEVSKATPPELLLPMLRGRKVVLVGDHRQLPPLFNEHEKTYREMLVSNGGDKQFEAELTIEDFKKYEKLVTSSLFEEYFENAPDDIKATLTIQYRMHEEIMDIINHFYDGYLLDGYEDMYTEDTKAHYLDIKTRTGYNMIVPEHHAYWIDSSTLWGERICEQQKEGSTSFENIVEAEIILELLRKIEFQYANNKTITSPVTVGVISFYFDQVSLLRNMIKKESFNSIDVEVNTVDRFQGKEKEVILVSLVRNSNSKKRSTGSYIAAFQRINVAFSRAQNLLLIVGSKDMYMNQPVELNDMNTGKVRTEYIYKEILHLLDERGTYFKGEDILSETRIHKILEYLDKKKE